MFDFFGSRSIRYLPCQPLVVCRVDFRDRNHDIDTTPGTLLVGGIDYVRLIGPRPVGQV